VALRAGQSPSKALANPRATQPVRTRPDPGVDRPVLVSHDPSAAIHLHSACVPLATPLSWLLAV